MAKIKLEKYVPATVAALAMIDENTITEHVRAVRASGEYNDLLKRIVYDCGRAVRYWAIIADESEANDSAVFSLLKKAFNICFPRIYGELAAA